MEIRNIKDNADFWAGAMFILFGAVAVYMARNYPMGSAMRMGPGYFPMYLGILIELPREFRILKVAQNIATWEVFDEASRQGEVHGRIQGGGGAAGGIRPQACRCGQGTRGG